MPLLTPETIGNSFARIVYNGFVFPAYHTARMQSVPVPDSSNRVTRHLKFNLSVDTVITWDSFDGSSGTNPGNYLAGAENISNLGTGTLASGDRLDTVTLKFLRALLVKGKRLEIEGLGFGTIIVDPSSTSEREVADLDNGPTPKIGNIEWIRAGRVLRFTWECEFTLSACTKKISKALPTIDAIAFSITYDNAENGMMTRTISGSVTIPNFVNSNHKSAINPDIARVTGSIKDRILGAFPAPFNCQRTHSFTNNATRTQLDFSITDTEIASDNPYYPGTVRMDVSHTVSNDVDLAAADDDTGLTWTMSISGSVEVAPGYPKSLGWLAIVSVLASRVHVANLQDESYWQARFSITEDIFSRTIGFSVTYKGAFSFENFFQKTRLLQPLRDRRIKWEDWNNNRRTLVDAYGADGEQVFNPNGIEDYVLTLCDGNDARTPSLRLTEPKQRTEDSLFDINVTKGIGTKITTKDSYSYYRNVVMRTSDYNVVTPAVIGSGDAAQQAFDEDGTNSLSVGRLTGNTLNLNVTTGENVANTVQQRGTGQHYIIVKGRAERVGYPVPIPVLQSTGEDLPTPVLKSERLVDSQIKSYTSDDVPIYFAEWYRVYCLPKLGDRAIRVSNIPIVFQTPERGQAGTRFQLQQVSYNLFNWPKPRVS